MVRGEFYTLTVVVTQISAYDKTAYNDTCALIHVHVRADEIGINSVVSTSVTSWYLMLYYSYMSSLGEVR